MAFDFDTDIERRGSGCAKYDAAEARGYPQDILPLWIADMDFQAPPCVLEALSKAVSYGVFGYPHLKDSYYRAVTDWFARRFGWQTEREWIVPTPGVVFALATAVKAFTEPGDNILIQTPVYAPFYRVVKTNGRNIVENPLIYENGKYIVDFDDLEKKLANCDIKLMILCSPHNPICRVWTRAELERVGALCKQYGVLVIADEIHCDFAFPDHPHTPFLVACPDMAEKTMVCTAPSKSFNLAGLQASNIFIPGEPLREAFRRELVRVGGGEINALGAVACEAAYREGEPWLEECKAYMRENLSYVRRFLAEHLPELRLVEPEGTYFAWLDCSGLGLTPEALEDLIVNKAGLWLDTGSMFGKAAEQFQRVVLACPRKTVAEAMERLKKAVNG